MSNLFISKADCTCVIWCRIEILTVVYICEPVTSNPSILWTLALHKLFVSQPVHMPSARGASTQVNLLQEYAFDINFPVILHFLNLVYLIDLSTKLSKASVSHISHVSAPNECSVQGTGLGQVRKCISRMCVIWVPGCSHWAIAPAWLHCLPVQVWILASEM